MRYVLDGHDVRELSCGSDHATREQIEAGAPMFEGTHEQLVARSGGAYARLYQLQLQGTGI